MSEALRPDLTASTTTTSTNKQTSGLMLFTSSVSSSRSIEIMDENKVKSNDEMGENIVKSITDLSSYLDSLEVDNNNTDSDRVVCALVAVFKHISNLESVEDLKWNNVSSTNVGFSPDKKALVTSETFTSMVGKLVNVLRHSEKIKLSFLGLVSHCCTFDKILWLNYGILDVLNCSFDGQYSVQTRKLAFDLSFVLISELLKPKEYAFGFQDLQNKPYQQSAIRIFLKLLTSFIVTFPAHYPFMPVEHFAEVQWPVKKEETCSGKVKSILSFGKKSHDQKNASDASNANTKDNDMNLTGKECVLWNDTRSSREPWVNTLHLNGFIQLEKVLFSVDATDKSPLFHEILSENGVLLQNVLTRFGSIGSQLLYSNTDAYHNSAHCAECALEFSFFSVTANKSRHHCRICYSSVCTNCSVAQCWLKKRVCLGCAESLVRLHIVSADVLSAKDARGSFSSVFQKLTSSNLSSADRKSGSAVTVATVTSSITNNEGNANNNDDLDAFDEDDVGGLSRCCSVLLSNDLRAWRDAPTETEQAQYLEGVLNALGEEDEEESLSVLHDDLDHYEVGGSRLDSPCCSETISDSLRSWRDQQESPSEEEMGGNRYMESE